MRSGRDQDELRPPAENQPEFRLSAGGTNLDYSDVGTRPKEIRMAGGTIKRLVRDRGFGFIRDDGGQEWFFHRSSVQGNFDELNEGQRVSFEEEPSAKGPRAGNVRSDAA
jgi:cold shock protein